MRERAGCPDGTSWRLVWDQHFLSLSLKHCSSWKQILVASLVTEYCPRVCAYVWASVYVFLRGHRPSTFADDNPIKHLLAAPWPPPAPDCTAERETTFGAALPVSPVTLPWASTRFVLLSSVQSFSHVWLCYPLDSSPPSLPVHHQLSEFTQTHVHWVGDAIQPSQPLSYPSPPAFNPSQHQGLFQWVSYSHQVAKVLEFQLQHQSFQWIYRTDFL